MFRITKAEEQSRTILTVDGQLSAESIAAVETCCSQAGSNGKAVQLYLRDVTSVDQDGQKLLTRLAARGIHLIASGVYTSYLVQALIKGENGSRNSAVEKHRIAKEPSKKQ